MAEPFVNIEFSDDPDAMAQGVYDYIRVRWPDWEPSDGNLETWIVLATSRLASEVASLASQASQEIFKTFGAQVAGIPPFTSASAQANTTWTTNDTVDHVIPAGTLVGIPNSNGDLIAFATVDDYKVVAGASVTTAGAVLLRAVDVGEEANGLTGTPVMISSLAYVVSVALVGSTSGGVDDEDPASYVNRLTEELQLSSPRPILPRDFQVLAKRVSGISRVVAVDGWKPADNTLNNERYIGIAVTDAAGEQPSAGVKTALETYLDGLREVNFVVKVGSPTYTNIDVVTTVRCYPTFTPSQVHDDVVAALQSYLSPANWGLPRFGQDERAWLNTTKVRFLEVAETINRVTGVDYIESVTVEGGVVDVNLSGVVPLTRADVITVTANGA